MSISVQLGSESGFHIHRLKGRPARSCQQNKVKLSRAMIYAGRARPVNSTVMPAGKNGGVELLLLKFWIHYITNPAPIPK